MPFKNIPPNLRPIFNLGARNLSYASGEKRVDVTGQSVEMDAYSEAIEFVLPWKFLLPRDDAKRGGYDLMADFSVWLIEYLLQRNQTVVPIVNFGDWMSLPVRRSRRRVSWHTRGQERGHLHLKIGVYPDHVSMDEAGFSGWSKFSANPISSTPHQSEELLQFEKLKEFVVEGKISKYSQPETRGRQEFHGNYLFFPMQIPRDVVAKLAWIDTISLLKILADFASMSPRKIVVKRHPKCTSRRVGDLIERVKGTPNLFFSHDNIHDLIGEADAVLTVNSGVGAEALLHRKPVIVTGASDYMAAAIQVRNKRELIEKLSEPIISPPEIDITKFIADYCTRYMVKLGDDRSMAGHPTLQQFLLSKAPRVYD